MAAPKTETISTGRNVSFHVEGGKLHIIVPVDDATIAASPASGSGKNKSVASTLGNVAIPGTKVKLGLNVYAPNT